MFDRREAMALTFLGGAMLTAGGGLTTGARATSVIAPGADSTAEMALTLVSIPIKATNYGDEHERHEAASRKRHPTW